jgi:hypothetical protein
MRLACGQSCASAWLIGSTEWLSAWISAMRGMEEVVFMMSSGNCFG